MPETRKMRAHFLCLVLCSAALFAQANKPASKPEFRIAGVVHDATSGQTLPGVRVSLGSTGANHVPDRSMITGPDGSFAFDHLTADKYQMYAETVGYPLQGFEEHEPPYLTGVVVGPNNPADHLAFRLQRGNAISGVVTNEFNDPVRDARVMLFRRGIDNGRYSTHFAREAQTDDRGFYKFAPLLPGTYFVAVSATPWYAQTPPEMPKGTTDFASPQLVENTRRLDRAFPLTFYSGTTDCSDATPIAVRNGERASADISLRSVPAVTLRISQAGLKNVPFVRLSQRVFGDFEVPTFAREQSNGKDLIISALAAGQYLAHTILPGAKGDRVQAVDVSQGTTIDYQSFDAPGSCVLKGLAQMSGGQKLPHGIMVALTRHNRGGVVADVDEKGNFAFERLSPGTYEVSIVNSRSLYLLDMAAANAKINGRSLTIDGSSNVDLALVLGKGMAEIHGFAMRDGKGLGGTMVLLAPVNAGANSVLFRRDQSDSDGSFTLSRVVPGRYYVISIQDGWDLEWAKQEILNRYLAKATKIDVALGGKYEVRVQVQNAKIDGS